jgi:hypothetical protein
MKKTLLIGLMAFCFATICFSQNYNTGIGIRSGFYNGITVKHFLSPYTAFEGIVTTRWRGIELTGLYEFQNRFFGAERLNWFFGVGGHIGFWDGNYAPWGTPGSDYTVIGIDGILGLEYSFYAIPISLGLDWKPALNLIGQSGVWADGVALSARFIF